MAKHVFSVMASFDGLSENICTETNTPIFKIIERYFGVFTVYLLKLNLQKGLMSNSFGATEPTLWTICHTQLTGAEWRIYASVN